MNQEGFVYVIHAVGTNRIKIGYTTDLKARLRSLQTAAPFPLQMLANWPGTEARERRVHRYLSQFRKVGEWFEVPPFTVGHQIWQLVTQGGVTGKIECAEKSRRTIPATRTSQKARKLPAVPKGYELRWQSASILLYQRDSYRDEQGNRRYKRKYFGSFGAADSAALMKMSKSEQLAKINERIQERS